ncbi:MAG: hypothetical protein COW65_04750 [Cytophagales bacterium CG18_big_fil_WC_8_21_14_2_50_42_9]|nr:MAG: hypothetical protein COW65_04750 [Cytophagales bacterium CG18_big_fil_WC_8_21_14_2_50_42_9]
MLEIEAHKNNLEEFDIHVPLNITTADAGSDGRISWNGKPASTKWLKNKFTVFQNKATSLFPQACYEEILEPQKLNELRKLKAQVEKVVQANGCFILFTNIAIVDNGKDERIKNFRNAIKDAGHANYNTFDIKVYDSNSIKSWVNENIAAVSKVQEFLRINRPQGFITWDKWSLLASADNNSYKENKLIQNFINEINSSIINEKVIRIYGHSGLGKTRLALEAFRGHSLKSSLVYFDLSGYLDISQIKNYLINHQDHQFGIIVIDNCSYKSHVILSEIVKSYGNLRVITIGFDDSESNEDPKIKLERRNQFEIVREIINEKLSLTHSQADINFLANLCEGYPWMAKRFSANILKKSLSEFNSSLPSDTIIKILFGESEKEKDYKIIRACSIFSSFGFPDDEILEVLNSEKIDYLENQLEYIRTNILEIEVSRSEFFEICQKYKNEDIIERHGSYYIVKPTILAINLAADWLKNTPGRRIIEILTHLKGSELGIKIAERIKHLDQLNKAHQIVSELWGPNSFFSTAEVLNTAWGSLLFRHVVEVNPLATAKALEKTFGDLSKSELLEAEEGRRNLVWALEKLCFRKEIFPIASKILYSFAVAENESWGNNSTNQFAQLFQVHLSGTEADYNERIEILDWGIQRNDDDYLQIAIQALGRGLAYEHLSRMGGAEQQGSSAPLKDYMPKTWEEIYVYWSNIYERLIKIATSENIYSDLALEKLSNSFRTLIRNGNIDLVEFAINEILKYKGTWLEAMNSLKKVQGFEKDLNEEEKAKLITLINLLTPLDLKNQIYLKITAPEWDTFEQDENGHFIDKPFINAVNFADSLIKNDIKWMEFLPDLLKGRQQQSFNFGKRLGELIEEKETFVNSALEILKSIHDSEQNIDLIGGFLLGTKDSDLIQKTINYLILEPNLRKHSFSITRISQTNYSSILNLFVLVDQYGFSINQFRNFQYGRALDSLKNEEVIQLCQKISTYGIEGKWISLALLYMYCHDEEEKWLLNNNEFKNLILSENLIIQTNNLNSMDGHYWSDSVIKLLKIDNDVDFANRIANYIIEFCSSDNFNYSFESEVITVTRFLFNEYFEVVWPTFGNGIIGDYMTFFHLKHMIGAKNGSYSNSGIMFEEAGRNEIILNWVKQNPKEAPKRIANIMPIAISLEGKETWHPFSRAIIDEFGDEEEVLNELSANMGSYSITGTAIPYYETQKKLIEELLKSKNLKIKRWAESMLDYTIKSIKRENLGDEESRIF